MPLGMKNFFLGGLSERRLSLSSDLHREVSFSRSFVESRSRDLDDDDSRDRLSPDSLFRLVVDSLLVPLSLLLDVLLLL